MSDFAVNVVKITDPVLDHPNADGLSLITILGYTCISAKLDDGSHRYKVGDLVVYVPEGAVVPEYLLKPGFWDDKKGKGILAGSNGNRVKSIRLRDIFSTGILFATVQTNDFTLINWLQNEAGDSIKVSDGDDVAEFLGITKYEPPIPTALAGEVTSIHGKTARYDFESIQTLPDLFTPGEQVVVTEKLHGCLHENSLIMLPNGEEITIGAIIADESITKVLSFDADSGNFITRAITGRSKRKNLENKPWVKLSLETGRVLTLTYDHPIYSRDRKDWVNAGDILDGEDIESPIC